MTPTELLFAVGVAGSMLAALTGDRPEIPLGFAMVMLVVALIDMWGVSLVSIILAAALIVAMAGVRLYLTRHMLEGGDGGEMAVKVDHILGGEPPRPDGGRDGHDEPAQTDNGTERKPAASAFIDGFKRYLSFFGLLLPNRGHRED